MFIYFLNVYILCHVLSCYFNFLYWVFWVKQKKLVQLRKHPMKKEPHSFYLQIRIWLWSLGLIPNTNLHLGKPSFKRIYFMKKFHKMVTRDVQAVKQYYVADAKVVRFGKAKTRNIKHRKNCECCPVSLLNVR